jgi:hypothetical protein
MAISTYKTYLMYKADSSAEYTKLLDIKEFPDIGGDPEMLETTTLSDKMQTYILGIQSADAMEFTANYTAADYAKIEALGTENEYDFAVYFGGDSAGEPTGDKGKFSFKGQVSLKVNGAGVNEVVEMTVSIAPTSVITFEEK